jgi:hypothetical protein
MNLRGAKHYLSGSPLAGVVELAFGVLPVALVLSQ